MPIRAQETPTKDSLLKTRLLSDSEDALWGNDSASSAETGRRAPEMPPEIRGPVPGRPGESQLRGMPTLPPPTYELLTGLASRGAPRDRPVAGPG